MDDLPTSDIPPDPSRRDFDSEAPTSAGVPIPPAHGVRPAAGQTSPPLAGVGMRIATYEIQRVLGEGGMGMVYLAQQENPRRLVALKVIRPGALSERMLRRFEFEAHLLGRLQHPGIAQVYEAGMAQDERGRPLPFFAMEFIKGVPLTEFADRQRLSTRERLALVARICDAVAHAHQKGIIHRDLKPGNILVDESGQPKILDFGVARATDADLKTTTMQTDVGQLIGTVPYMSPEQVSGDPTELDTRSDVYAVGVIAYELLAGRLPHDLHKKMIHEAVRVIREEEPTRLSAINRTLRCDVETIVAKALEKDKSRRYATAESLASDIRCYLADQPISARPASGWYQFQKFTRRNRALVGGGVTALVLLIAGVIGTSIGLNRALIAEGQARAAETTARDEAAVSESVTQFVVGSIRNASPQRRGPEATVAETLLASVDQIDAQFADQPRVRERLHDAFADVYRGLNMYRESVDQLRTSLTLAEQRAPRSAQVLALRVRLGSQLNEMGDYVAAAAALRDAARLIASGVPADHGTQADIESTLGAIAHNLGDYALAEHHYRRLLALESAAAADTPEEQADRDLYCGIANDLLARLLIDAGYLAEGERRVRAALDLKKKARGEQTLPYAASVMTLAHLYNARGDWAAARREYSSALATFKTLQKDDRAPVVLLAQFCLDGVNADDPTQPQIAAPAPLPSLESMGGLGRMLVVQLRNRGRILLTLPGHSIAQRDRGTALIEQALALDATIADAATPLSQAHTLKDAARASRDLEFLRRAHDLEHAAGADDADTLVLLSKLLVDHSPTRMRSGGESETFKALGEALGFAESAVAARSSQAGSAPIPLAEALLAQADALAIAGRSDATKIAAVHAAARKARDLLAPVVEADDPRMAAIDALLNKEHP
ncbi:MAG: serine/threonine-protein kinase [Planctomycetota bacterium]|nr:serine/threonine-protein kinase [Planctomycetota bacterium]